MLSLLSTFVASRNGTVDIKMGATVSMVTVSAVDDAETLPEASWWTAVMLQSPCARVPRVQLPVVPDSEIEHVTVD